MNIKNAKALLQFVCKDAVRYNINFVRITKDFAEATDGHTLARVIDGGTLPEGLYDLADWREVICAGRACAPKHSLNADGTYGADSIRYPDTDQVIPKKIVAVSPDNAPSVSLFGVDPNLVARLGKFDVNHKSWRWQVKSELDPIRMDNENIVGVIMPTRI